MRHVLPALLLLTGCWPIINASIPPDGGPEADAGNCVCPTLDAGSPEILDAGETDAGETDAGALLDAGAALDAGASTALSATLRVGPQTVTVAVGAGGPVFTPATVTIHTGDTVLWVWAASGDSVTGGPATCVADQDFCSPDDQSCSQGTPSTIGATYVHTFAQAGTFPYFSAARCPAGMTGSVIVLP